MMIINSMIRRIIRKLTNTFTKRYLPRGIDLLQDITNHLPMLQVDVVFDVGANVGQSARKYLDWFPNCRIYCFEPVEETFRQLQTKFKTHSRIQSFQLALGSCQGEARMVHQDSAEMFHFIDHSEGLLTNDGLIVEKVNMDTLDNFCSRTNINHISYLKIDTEGEDLKVLKGSEKMLSAHLIDLVEVEAGMNCRNERHVPFEALKEFLESKQYYLFGIYEQVGEWITKQPQLRRSNLLFISEHVIVSNNERVKIATGSQKFETP